MIKKILFLLLYFLLLINNPCFSSTYEQKLPTQLTSSPNMCQWVDCHTVFPQADSFSDRKGNPYYVEAYQGPDKKLLGYVLLTTDIVDTVGYSGKPLITLIGMDIKGTITGIQLLKHSEPILLVGIPESKILAFLNQYIGRNVQDNFEIGQSATSEKEIDAISGATVTIIAENQAIVKSIRNIAEQVGIIKAQKKPQANLKKTFEMHDWNSLLKDGSIGHFLLKAKDIDKKQQDNPILLDLYFGYINEPNIGNSILGQEEYQKLMGTLKADEHAIFIVANGSESFKGSGFVRGGIYDRFQIKQDSESFTFRDSDYLNIYSIKAPNVPSFRESGIFIIRNKNFSAAYPWEFVFLAHTIDQETGVKTFKAFNTSYWLPKKYFIGARPEVETSTIPWKKSWSLNKLDITIFSIWIIFVISFFITRDKWIRKSNRKNKKWVSLPKYTSWIFAIGFVGFYKMAQPSITQVFTIFHSISSDWDWGLFLSDPIIFIFWWVIIITLLIWGRGLFCGWMCPFGALTESLHKIAKKIGLGKFQYELPKKWHNKLRWLKYFIFIVLVLISFYQITLAEKLAEIEPFKTIFLVGFWNRSWPFILFLMIILGLSILVERPFCKYLCPLGAGLAIPTRFSLIRLKRKKECTSCHACANGCGSLAIDEQGKIDNMECMLCHDCMILYYDDHSCPPLAKERKQREKASLPLTKINKEGYFIPIHHANND